MIFDDVAKIMLQEPCRDISRKTGLSRSKIYRLSQGVPFVLDYNTVFALNRLGYEIKIEKKPENIKNCSTKKPPNVP
ncbi:MAG: hypothetical protein NC489_45605 [Ruminococcus flavefaciens]|nr:hypothetical protein [Ruminococcus flavefaciens]